jgi:hypothetical protein
MGQEQHLGDDHIGYVIVDRGTQEDDAVFQQPRVDVEGALATICALDNGGDEILDGRDTHGWENSTLVNGRERAAGRR